VAGQTVTINQAGVPTACSYSIAPGRFSAPASGATVHVSVTTAANCSWTVFNGLPGWISATPSSGNGNGTVTLTAQPNSSFARSSNFTIATQPFTLDQEAACSYAIDPSAFNNVAAAGGNTTVSVTTSDGCGWTVTGNPSWVQIGTASGSGSGSTRVTLQPNAGAPRTATFQIASQTFSVAQSGSCTYTVSPASFTLSSADQSRTISVTTQAGCTTQASAGAGWLHITATPPAGGGTVSFDVDRNGGQNSRTSSITITGVSFSTTVPVTQNGK